MAKFFICGDIVNYTDSNCFIESELRELIRSADFAICNLEGVELQEGNGISFPCQNAGTIRYLKEVGFKLFLLANNHITDAGKRALKYTLDTIDSNNLYKIGAGLSWNDAYKPLEICLDGIRFAFFNVCEAQVGQYVSVEQSFGYAWLGNEEVIQTINTIKSRVDHVVVFVHTGLEHYNIPTPEVRVFYRKLCDVGATCVVGGHTHSAQGYEFYGQSLIIYSLGNFFFPPTKRWPNELSSYSVILDFTRTNVTLKPVFHTNNGAIVSISNDCVGLEELITKLGNNYEVLSDEMIQKAWNTLLERLIVEATCGQSGKESFKRICNNTFSYFFLRDKTIIKTKERRQKLLLRLFENETYRSLIIHYLKQNYDK